MLAAHENAAAVPCAADAGRSERESGSGRKPEGERAPCGRYAGGAEVRRSMPRRADAIREQDQSAGNKTYLL